MLDKSRNKHTLFSFRHHGILPRKRCFKETTVKLRGKSSDPNQLFSSHHSMMTKAMQCIGLFLKLPNINFTSQVQEYNPTDEAIP